MEMGNKFISKTKMGNLPESRRKKRFTWITQHSQMDSPNHFIFLTTTQLPLAALREWLSFWWSRA
jgi:hypothetical protein